MRNSLFLLLTTIALCGLGCSDDGAAGNPDTGTDQAVTNADGPQNEASAGDKGAADSSATDGVALGDMVGPAPGLPSNLTMYINVGDSLAVGYPASTGLSYKELLMSNNDTTYPTYKGKDLKTKYPNIKLVDKAAFGALSSQLPAQISAVGGNPKGDTLVVISIGGNDFAGAVIQLSLDANAGKTLAKQVTGYITTALAPLADKTKYPGKVAVVLMTFHDPTDGAGKIPAVKGLTGFCQMVQLAGPVVGPTVIKAMGLFNTELKTWAQANKIMIADNHAHALGHGWNYNDKTNKYYDSKDPTLWFHTDCLHANDRGNGEMRKVIWSRMTGDK